MSALIEAKAAATSNLVFERGISWSKVHEITAKTCELANIDKLRFHDLRHSFASNLVMNGVSIYDVKTLMGHSSEKQTERYSHLAPNHLLGKTDSLFPTMNPTMPSNVVSLFA